jgi:low affinity Fe/Cu permease
MKVLSEKPSSIALLAVIVVILIVAVAGAMVHFSDKWQFVISSSAIIAALLVMLPRGSGKG